MRLRSIGGFILFTWFLSTLSCMNSPVPDETEGNFQLFEGQKQGAILGGYVDDADTAVVGLVYIESNFIASSCSGSLIAPNVVLTAQHCIANISTNDGIDCGVSEYLTPFGTYSLGVTTDTTITGYTQFTGVSEIHVPDFSAEIPGGNPKEACNNDIAILVLATPIDTGIASPLVPRVDEPLGNFEQYSAIGYGIDNLNGSGGFVRRRKDNLITQCVGLDCGNPGIPSVIWVGDPGSVCIGDSGGPGLDLNNRVAGVASVVTGGNCDYPLYSHIFPWGDWIKSVTETATSQAGITTPAWALGAPTDPNFTPEVGGLCEESGDCLSGICIEGICSTSCIEDSNCPVGFSCEDGTCAPAPLGGVCEEESNLPITSELCTSGLCLKGHCTRTCDALIPFCPDGYQCKEGVCALIPVGGPCGNDWDCPNLSMCYQQHYCTRYCDLFAPCPPSTSCSAESVCVSDEPTSVPCTSSKECEGGWCTDEGTCSPACVEDEECPGDLVCDIESGACVLLHDEDVWVEEEDAMMQPDGETEETVEDTEEILDEDGVTDSERTQEGESDAEIDDSTSNSSLSPVPDGDGETVEETIERKSEIQEVISPESASNEAGMLPESEANMRDNSGGETTDLERSRMDENRGCQSNGNGSGALAVLGFMLFLMRQRKPISMS